MKAETSLPLFNGFYETYEAECVHQYEFDRYCQNDCGDHISCECIGNLTTEQYRAAEALYVNKLIAKINALEVAKDLGIKFKFKRIFSPREYNQDTDHVYVDATFNRQALLAYLKQDEHFAGYVAERMKARNGFIPYYSDDAAEWLEWLRTMRADGKDTHARLRLIFEFVFLDSELADDYERYEAMREAMEC